MPKRDFHSTLGVPAGAGIEAIKQAYRRLALKVHPDTGAEPDPARFREVHEAYLVLSEAARRRSRDAHIGRTWVPMDEIGARRAVNVPGDFASVAPSFGEMLDHIAQNFFGFHRKSGGPCRRLALEIVLSEEEARSGGRLPIEVPSHEPCPRCAAQAWRWGLCPLCHGYGLAEISARVMLEIPPGVADGSCYEVTLDSAGINNLTLDVTVLVE
jgi:molecular chaperone DnaJ